MKPAATDKPANSTSSRPRRRRALSLFAIGEPWIWLTHAALILCVAMIVCLVALVIYQGAQTFIPRPVAAMTLLDGTSVLGEVSRSESHRPTELAVREQCGDAFFAEGTARLGALGGESQRDLLRIGNYEITGEHFRWISSYIVRAESRPADVVVLERMTWGRFYGTPKSFQIGERTEASGSDAAWKAFQSHHDACRARFEVRRRLERVELGAVNHAMEDARRTVRRAELAGDHDELVRVKHEKSLRMLDLESEATALRSRITAIDKENESYVLMMVVAGGNEVPIKVADVVRAYQPNRLSLADKLSILGSRWGEFLIDEPREANSEGGVWPAIFGTVVMTLLMSLAVVPIGVLAALYLREYAKAGAITSAVRIAVNNLAGVPSIVFGVFGLGFFCYTVGAGIDTLFFPEKLPSPTFGTGGILWSALTLALMTLPVVIVATEEALAAVPSSMREGSYACGASKWQTIWRIVLPKAMPGIMTGTILAMARGAGEVAPLMLVGAVKLAPDLPIDGIFPYFHLERSFMHLGFHVYDLGFQSPNSEAAKPMVYTTTLLLIVVIVTLNLAAIRIRTVLRRKFAGAQF